MPVGWAFMTVYAAELYQNVSTRGNSMPGCGMEVMIYGGETEHPGSISRVIFLHFHVIMFPKP